LNWKRHYTLVATWKIDCPRREFENLWGGSLEGLREMVVDDDVRKPAITLDKTVYWLESTEWELVKDVVLPEEEDAIRAVWKSGVSAMKKALEQVK
jgi:hypothetical protein